MKLLKRPETVVHYIDTVAIGGSSVRMAGRTTISDVEIVAPDIENPKDKVWSRLKYGTTPDLGDAYLRREKIDRIEFPEDGIVLHGVIPFEQTRTDLWEGCMYKCKIDYYEEI